MKNHFFTVYKGAEFYKNLVFTEEQIRARGFNPDEMRSVIDMEKNLTEWIKHADNIDVVTVEYTGSKEVEFKHATPK